MILPVAIAGMHRSGTSMITRLVHLCGLSLGPADDLLDANEGNPEGHWESLSLMEINDEILARFGGNWHAPPALPPQWHCDPRLDDLRELARGRLAVITTPDGAWAWKDPRTSLTLRFWQDMVPDLVALVCVRNPVEVAASLQRRDRFATAYTLDAWLAYNRAALEATTPASRVVTHYASYFIDPVGELRRVCQELGIAVDDERLARALDTVRGELRHRHSSYGELLKVRPGAAVGRTYARLCMEAGPILWPTFADEIGDMAGAPRRARIARAATQARLWVRRRRIEQKAQAGANVTRA